MHRVESVVTKSSEKDFCLYLAYKIYGKGAVKLFLLGRIP